MYVVYFSDYMKEEEMVLENEIKSFQNTIDTYQSKVFLVSFCLVVVGIIAAGRKASLKRAGGYAICDSAVSGTTGT